MLTHRVDRQADWIDLCKVARVHRLLLIVFENFCDKLELSM